jgi:hypothetical protein
MTATDIATLATAAFAAVAAGASWATVAQTRKERRAARIPEMSIEVMGRNGYAHAHLSNHGCAVRAVQFALFADGQLTFGTPQPSPMFQPGEHRLMQTGIAITRDSKAVGYVSCYEITGRDVYVWWSDGTHRKYRVSDHPTEQVSPSDLLAVILGYKIDVRAVRAVRHDRVPDVA